MVFLPLKKFIGSAVASDDGAVVCGLDEVGRGPWAGPLVACALILKRDVRFKGLKDSKKMTAAAREKIRRILEKKSWYGLGRVEPREIDALGIIAANNLAFNRALEDLKKRHGPVKPAILLVDGRDRLKLPFPHLTVIKGDEKIKVIACASIVAKVERDALMVGLAGKYPQYGFDLHKGYGTAMHQKALKKYGPCEIHRQSFAPVASLSGKTLRLRPKPSR
jgi:ribonuclease HII